jgi:hypothetical protein
MEKCPVCSSSLLVKNASLYGEETFCSKCRRIITSASLGFKFAAEEPEPCKTPDGRPGFKGPGAKAVCHGYTDDDEKAKAYESAKASVYATEHRKAASKLINGIAFFTGLPAYAQVDPDATEAQDFSDEATDQPVQPESPIGDSLSKKIQAFDEHAGSPIAVVTTEDGHQQNDDLNGDGTFLNTASKRLAELIEKELGPGFCTEHMAYDRCNETE